jgi:hypothetical protein
MTKTSRPGRILRLSRRKWHWPRSSARRRWEELAQQFDVHPNQITKWKGQLLEGAAGIFDQEKLEGKEAAVDLKALGQILTEIDTKTTFSLPANSKFSFLWRLAKDFENLNRNALAFLHLASIPPLVQKTLQSSVKFTDSETGNLHHEALASREGLAFGSDALLNELQ